MVLELPNDSANLDGDVVCDGTLPVSEGSLRAVAGLMVWLALLACWKEDMDDLQHPQVINLMSSLLAINCSFDLDTSADGAEKVVRWAIKQNIASKVQSVSTFQWASKLVRSGCIALSSAL